jgi:hypothetical protein
MPLTSGTRLGPYEIVSLLGTGGMGEVYRARDTGSAQRGDQLLSWGRPGTQPARAPFGQARAISSLAHPNVCTLFDVGETDGQVFLVMEHVERDARRRLRRGRIERPLALRWAVTGRAAGLSLPRRGHSITLYRRPDLVAASRRPPRRQPVLLRSPSSPSATCR